jgi:hypothetical protein
MSTRWLPCAALVLLSPATTACKSADCRESATCVAPTADEAGAADSPVDAGTPDALPDLVPPEPVDGGEFDLQDLSWAGWWDGDNYNPLTGVAAGKLSAGLSAGRNATSPGTKPPAGPELNGHRSIEGAAATGNEGRWLTTGMNLSAFVSSDSFVAYAVVKVVRAGYAYAGGSLPGILSTPSSLWVLGGARSTEPSLDTFFRDSDKVYHDLLLDSTRGYELDKVFLYEARLSGGSLSARINDGTEISQQAKTIHPDALTAKMQFFCTSNQGGYFGGTLYELAITDRPLSDEIRQKVRHALMSKYGLE